MSMFSALIPKSENAYLGTESYEEIVESFCGALEDVEEVQGALEDMGESIDNAEAFAAAIESCGATPALFKFGAACDSDFDQLIGRAIPSDFATEDMNEFGAFALESVKSKLHLAWEHVKNFIIKLWEKIKEFGRWVLRLFDRKKARLEAIAKQGAGDLPEAFKSKEFKKALTKADTIKMIADIKAGFGKPPVDGEGAVTTAITGILKDFGWAADANGGMKKSGDGKYKAMKGSDLGITNKSDIAAMAKSAAEMLGARNDFNKLLAEMDKSKAEVDKVIKEVLNKIEDAVAKDTAKRELIVATRKAAIARSRCIVALAKEANNIAAFVIQVAKAAGM